jgi:membrane protein
VKPKKQSGIIQFLRVRWLSFTVVVGTAFLMLVSLAVTAALAAMGKLMEHALPAGSAILTIVSFALSLVVTSGVFALIFKVLPDVRLRWRDVAVGAGVTAVLFAVGQSLLGLYIRHGNIATGNGAAGSLIVVLVWVYYSSQILFFGAEFTHVYVRRFGTASLKETAAGTALPEI